MLDAKNSLMHNYENYLKLKFCMNGTVVFTKDILDELGGWDSSTRIAADTDIFLRVLAKHKIYNLQEQLYCRVFHKNSLTATKKYGINSQIRKQYNLTRIPTIEQTLLGNIVKRDFAYPDLNYKII